MVWASAVTVRSLGAAPALIAGAFHGTVMTGAGAIAVSSSLSRACGAVRLALAAFGVQRAPPADYPRQLARIAYVCNWFE